MNDAPEAKDRNKEGHLVELETPRRQRTSINLLELGIDKDV